MSDLFSLKGRVALVTGSSQGIGLGIAMALANAGATVAVNGRNSDKVKDAMGRISAAGGNAVACSFDVMDEPGIVSAVAALEKSTGPVDILFNNAGINLRGPLLDYAVSDWRQVMGTNVDGVFLVSRIVATSMIARGRGKIVNITSLSADLTRAGSGPYAASKAAARMLTKAMAVEWGPHNIQVNAISPGWNKTDIMKEALKKNPDLEAWVNSRTPLGRWSDPNTDVGGAAVFLASAASDFITGQTLAIDGGFSATF
jgi:gluconate 5-dehydrogenase